MSTEGNTDLQVGNFIERAKREMEEAARQRLATLEAEEAQLQATVSLAQALKPELAVEARELMTRVQSERTTIEQALEQLGHPLPKPPEAPRPQEPAKPEPPKVAEAPKAQEPPAPGPRGPEAPAAQPAAKPTGRATVPQGYLDEVDAHQKRVLALTNRQSWDACLYYELRRAVAATRDLIARGRQHKATATVGRLEDHLEDLMRWYTEMGRPAGFVYGFSREHHGGNEGWGYLVRAYEVLEQAEECVRALESSSYRLPRTQELSVQCWRAQLLFRRVCNRHGMSLAEPRQEQVRDALREAVSARLLKELPADQLPDLDAAFESLRGLRVALHDALKAGPRGDEREASLSAVEEAASAGDLAPLVRLAAGALDAGVPPSDKRLRAALTPHLDALRGAGLNGQFARLVEYLESDAGSRGPEEEPAGDEPDVDLGEAEYQRMLSEVRQVSAGKRVLFLGGDTDPEKVSAPERELGLRELDWPAGKSSTSLGFYLERVPRADVVVRLTRFSRKHYKQAMDSAKSQGKLCVTLQGGIGLHNVVRAFHEQLVPRPR